MNMFIYIQQVAGLVLVQVICSLNAATILNTVLYFGMVLFIIQFFGKNPDISKDGGAWSFSHNKGESHTGLMGCWGSGVKL